MFKTPRIFITLDTIPDRPFYTVGDVISGFITTEIDSSQFTYEDIQVKLKCDEFFPNGRSKSQSKRRQERWNQRIDMVGSLAGVDLGSANMTAKLYMDHKKHFSLVANVKSGLDKGRGEGEVPLEPGRHRFPFQILVPDRANNCPPSSYMGELKDGVIGVIWTVKVVLHRRTGFKLAIRETKAINVFPQNDGTLKMPDFRVTDRLFSTHKLAGKKGGFLRKLGGGGTPSLYLSGEFLSPREGLPQGPIPPHCSLLVVSQPAPVNITGLKLSIVRVFKGTGMFGGRESDWFTDEIVLGQCSLNRDITEPTDLSKFVNQFSLDIPLPRAFTGKHMKVYYVVEMRVFCRNSLNPKDQRRKGDPEHLLIRGPINVASPLVCYTKKAVPEAPPVSYDDIEKLKETHKNNVNNAEKSAHELKEEESAMDYTEFDKDEELPVYSRD